MKKDAAASRKLDSPMRLKIPDSKFNTDFGDGQVEQAICQ